ncbi:MAG: hypothetical protein ACHQ2Y_06710 [Candidatus Lutacidiplasmatales archaeon]
MDRVYSIAYSDDPSIGTLTPTLCSHQATKLVTVHSRKPDPGSPTPGLGTFAVCGTHLAIIGALDRVIATYGGKPRLVEQVDLAPEDE